MQKDPETRKGRARGSRHEQNRVFSAFGICAAAEWIVFRRRKTTQPALSGDGSRKLNCLYALLEKDGDFKQRLSVCASRPVQKHTATIHIGAYTCPPGISLLKIAKKIPYTPGQHFVLDQKAAKLIQKHNIKTYIIGPDTNNLNNLLNNKHFVGTIVG